MFDSSLSRRIVLKMGYLEMFRYDSAPTKGLLLFSISSENLLMLPQHEDSKRSCLVGTRKGALTITHNGDVTKATLTTHNSKR